MLLNIAICTSILDTKVILKEFVFASLRFRAYTSGATENGNRCFYYNLMRELFEITRAISMFPALCCGKLSLFFFSPQTISIFAKRLDIIKIIRSCSSSEACSELKSHLKTNPRLRNEFEYMWFAHDFDENV